MKDEEAGGVRIGEKQRVRERNGRGNIWCH